MLRFRSASRLPGRLVLRATSPSPSVTPLLVGEALAFHKLCLFARGSPTRGAGIAKQCLRGCTTSHVSVLYYGCQNVILRTTSQSRLRLDSSPCRRATGESVVVVLDEQSFSHSETTGLRSRDSRMLAQRPLLERCPAVAAKGGELAAKQPERFVFNTSRSERLPHKTQKPPPGGPAGAWDAYFREAQDWQAVMRLIL